MSLKNRMAVRLALRRIKNDKDVDTVLANPAMFADLVDSLEGEHTAHAGPIQDFLTWLLTNQESLLSFVKSIIALFSVK